MPFFPPAKQRPPFLQALLPYLCPPKGFQPAGRAGHFHERFYSYLPMPVLLLFQIFTKQYLAKLLHCMAWNYQAAKQ
ncbi:MAG: hypothetical protein K1W05_00290, partial [Desulfovibrio sp.]